MKRVAVLGADGMLGSMISKFLKENTDYEIKDYTKKDFDAATVTQKELSKKLFNIDVVINCIGVINKYIDEYNDDSVINAILVNSVFPYKLKKIGIKVIQIATDCAGENDVYGLSKALGEVKSGIYNIRCSIVGPGNKDGLLDWFLNEEGVVYGYKTHFWNGVTTLAFAKLCKGLIDKDFFPTNVDFVPYDFVNKYELLKLFKKYYKKDIKIIPTDGPQVNRIVQDKYNASKSLWYLAGYKKVPSIKDLIKELSIYGGKNGK